MNYQQALDYLATLAKFGIHLGLTRIEALLAQLDNPQHKLKTIHVAGTNGKGSTTAILTSILTEAGYTVGTYTSPHLTSYTERIAVNGKPISETEFANLFTKMQPVVVEVRNLRQEQPTEFEVLTAAMFYYFAEQQVDIAVIETGLGGRFDSTNVITPLVSVITNIAYDHTDRCGQTLTEIAWHKAGIIKKGVPVVTAATEEGLAVIAETCDQLGSPLTVIGRDIFVEAEDMSLQGQRFTLTLEKDRIENISLPLLGKHQLSNAAVAIGTIHLLQQQNFLISLAALRRGIKKTNWPGRFEMIQANPPVILDGAHNPDGARQMVETLLALFGEQRVVLVVGVLADKDIPNMMAQFERVAKTLVLTRPQSERAASADQLAQYVKNTPFVVCNDIKDAVHQATVVAGGTTPVCICGSLYMIASARELLLG